MHRIKKNFSAYFENIDLGINELYSFSIVKAIARSVLEPIASNHSKAVVFTRLKNIDDIDGLTKRLEYASDVTLREFSDFEFSKFDVDEIGFIVLTSQRYNCAFLFRQKEENKYEIYLKMNSCLVSEVYETLKSIFLINYDTEFYEYKPERRDNSLMNDALMNIIKSYHESIQENEYNSKIQENYKNINSTNTTFRNEIYENAKQIAHEIKNQLSIMDIYTRIFEKKTGDIESTEPIKKSIALIKSQIEQFKNIDVVNLQQRDIKSIIQESVKTYTNVLKEKNNKLVLIDEMPGYEASAFVDEEKFAIVVGNIIKNANDSTKNDEIIIKLIQDDERIKILFINHGEMIEPDDRDKIFETGYTTKKDGWGIGLSVCKKFIGSQFGTFELTKSDSEETVFTITLPIA